MVATSGAADGALTAKSDGLQAVGELGLTHVSC